MWYRSSTLSMSKSAKFCPNTITFSGQFCCLFWSWLKFSHNLVSDTGANTHTAPNLSNLDFSETYYGSDSLFGDGKPLPNFHIGSPKFNLLTKPSLFLIFFMFRQLKRILCPFNNSVMKIMFSLNLFFSWVQVIMVSIPYAFINSSIFLRSLSLPPKLLQPFGIDVLVIHINLFLVLLFLVVLYQFLQNNVLIMFILWIG